MRRSARVLLLPLLALVSVIACGDGEEAPPTATGTPTAVPTGAPTDGSEVAVVLTEWAVEPSPASVPAGEVTFVATNEGTILHELVIIRGDLAPDGLPVEEGQVPEDQIDLIAEIEEFAAGETESLTVNLDAGNYILICNIVGHYQLGMRSSFTIE
jgi:uncharacterized cupredoxin-like copper-binding protein